MRELQNCENDRAHRAIACASLEGFQSLSTRMRRDAPMTAHTLKGQCYTNPERAGLPYYSDQSLRSCSKARRRLRIGSGSATCTIDQYGCLHLFFLGLLLNSSTMGTRSFWAVALQSSFDWSASVPELRNTFTYPSRRQIGYFFEVQCACMISRVEVKLETTTIFSSPPFQSSSSRDPITRNFPAGQRA